MIFIVAYYLTAHFNINPEMVNKMRGIKFTYRPGGFLGILQVTEPVPPLRQGELSQNISPTEQLSREHAILMRLLIAIENVLVKASANVGTDLMPINRAASMINDVVCGHHMRFEESYVYPRVRESGNLVDFVNLLQDQHNEARDAVRRIMDLTRTGRVDDVVQMGELVALCKAADFMFRAHIAWEESVLFTALYDLAPTTYFEDLQHKMLGEERSMFGSKGLQQLYEDLADVERAAGTEHPSMFTTRRV